MGKNSWFDKEKDKETVAYAPCHKTHPALEINGFKIYGGSCSNPVVRDADIYIGLDYSMNFGIAPPWNGGVEYLHKITDMQAPLQFKEFHSMIVWLCEELQKGKKIHVGCIGGHGRTGTVLAAMVKLLTGEEDAISFVRNNYCKKAVESKSQIDFLNKNYHIKKVEPSKKFDHVPAFQSSWKSTASATTYSDYQSKHDYSVGGNRVEPTSHTAKNIWHRNPVFDKRTV